MATSQNGWSVVDKNGTTSYKITGTTRAIRLRDDEAGQLLVAFAAWFDKNIETIDNDRIMDDWGWAVRTIRGKTTGYSNHASATAIDLNATQHPLGAVNTYTNAQEVKVRAKLKSLGGVIRGGLDYSGRKDEMHFEINVPPTSSGKARIRAALAALKGSPAPGGGAAPKPPARPVNPTNVEEDKVIAASSIRYVANGGYLHIGQAEAKDDATTLAGWYIRLKRNRSAAELAQAERDVRVWKTLVNLASQSDRTADWKRAGVQYTGIVRHVQQHYGLTADGIFGPVTASKMAQDDYRII